MSDPRKETAKEAEVSDKSFVEVGRGSDDNVGEESSRMKRRQEMGFPGPRQRRLFCWLSSHYWQVGYKIQKQNKTKQEKNIILCSFMSMPTSRTLQINVALSSFLAAVGGRGA